MPSFRNNIWCDREAILLSCVTKMIVLPSSRLSFPSNFTMSNPIFEQFYRNHIRKLLINQKRIRYLAKNNYNITRLEYLHRLFPSVKFLLIIRNPVNHIASLIKQTRLFIELERNNPLLIDWHRITGHSEFGHHQLCINTGNNDLIHKIRRLWKNETTYVKGWAYYWSSIYDYVMNLLEANKKISKDNTSIINRSFILNSHLYLIFGNFFIFFNKIVRLK